VGIDGSFGRIATTAVIRHACAHVCRFDTFFVVDGREHERGVGAETSREPVDGLQVVVP
jgi:hypothetical protein